MPPPHTFIGGLLWWVVVVGAGPAWLWRRYQTRRGEKQAREGLERVIREQHYLPEDPAA